MTARLPDGLPPLLPEGPLDVPGVFQERLANGLEVWAVSRPGLPLVSLRLVFRGGRSLDAPDTPGFSNLLAAGLREGSIGHGGPQIAELLQAAGGDLSADANEDAITLSAWGLAARAGMLLDVLAELARSPAFRDRDVARLRSLAAEELATNETDPAFLADRAFRRAVFGAHPYGAAAPTEASIEAATPTRLRDEAARRLHPARCLLVAAGDADARQLAGEAARAFGCWRAAGEPPPEPARAVPPPGGPEVHVVDRPGSVQTHLMVGGLGVARSDGDAVPLSLAVTIYGGAFSSRLVTSLREDKGYTYSPGAASRWAVHRGIVETHAATRNEVTCPALREILSELGRMASSPVTDEELERGRRRDLGAFVVATETGAGLAQELADLWLNGLPPSDLGRSVLALKSVGIEDLRRVAASYLANPIRIVAVGDGPRLRAELAAFGPVVESQEL